MFFSFVDEMTPNREKDIQLAGICIMQTDLEHALQTLQDSQADAIGSPKVCK